MDRDPKGALAKFLQGDNPINRRIPQAVLARLLEVSPQMLTQYLNGQSVPSPARRHLIAAWSEGKIPADWWETEKERDEARLLRKLARLYPEYGARKAA